MQGIKSDVVDMPMFTNLLPEVKEEDETIINGEIDDEEDNDEDGDEIQDRGF